MMVIGQSSLLQVLVPAGFPPLSALHPKVQQVNLSNGPSSKPSGATHTGSREDIVS